jgi:manganese transport protein
VKWRITLGPGWLVTAAFVGPGTVTTASVAGAKFGYTLLWAILFSVLATVILQEMSARLGLVTRAGLGEALRSAFANPILRWLAVVLVVAAIAVGNAAFETGNITGAAMGLEMLTPIPRAVWAGASGLSALALLGLGGYRVVERLLIVLVVFMSLAFATTAIIVRPGFTDILRGLVVPQVQPGSLLTIVALIGTTVVPYNLFLHASTVCEKWSEQIPVGEALRRSRLDTVLSITMGGLVTLAIAVTAASCFKLGTGIDSAARMAEQLEPLLGRTAKWFFAAGLFAAGLTSAVTAPLAAAYAATGALGWCRDLRSWRFRAIWAGVIVVGTSLAMLGRRPVAAIVLAQAANGILLPIVAVFLLIVVNRRELLRDHANGVLSNALGLLVVLVAAGLGAVQIGKAYSTVFP